ncbi:hypothetical protein BGZ72_006050 [Mortierella alpina]|nr:hypothetical protein BGZ72_006050 [Mortierella alpina]
MDDASERIEIEQLLQDARGQERQVVFSGTNYGHCTMSETVPQALDEITAHISHFSLRKGYDQTEEEFAPDTSRSPEPPLTANPQLTKPDWEHRCCEDSTELLDITALLEGSQDDRQVVLSGTDYGLKTMSVTVPRTLSQCCEHTVSTDIMSSHPNLQANLRRVQPGPVGAPRSAAKRPRP